MTNVAVNERRRLISPFVTAFVSYQAYIIAVKTFAATSLAVLLSMSALAQRQPQPSEIAAADQLFRAGKFPKAETAYAAILQKDSSSIPAEVGFVRSMLRQQKVDESLDKITRASAAHPNSASLLAVRLIEYVVNPITWPSTRTGLKEVW